MITVTETAAKKIQDFIEANTELDKTKDIYLSLLVYGGGCAGFKYGMGFTDEKDESDFVFESSGVKILIDESSIKLLDGSKIDYVDDINGSGFNIENPNVESACGCGNSFKAKEEDPAEESTGGCCNGGGCC